MDIKPRPLYKGMSDASKRKPQNNLPGFRPSSELPASTTPAVSEEDIVSAFTEAEPVDPTDLTLPTDDRIFVEQPTSPQKPIEPKKPRFKKKVPILVLILLLLVVLGFGGFIMYKQKKAETHSTVTESQATEPIKKKTEEKTPVTKASPLTGREVTPEIADKKPTAIMIENSAEARPQSGLVEADMVFEAIAEGGITRFLSIYQEGVPAKIGPVRSARPYYAEWANMFHAAYVHAGGSDEGLQTIQNLGLDDVNALQYDGTALYRTTDRAAPHNLYTSISNLDKITSSMKTAPFTPYARKQDVPQTPTAKTITFALSSAFFNPTFTYDEKTNSYLRSEGGDPHLDDKGVQIAPKVVIGLITTRTTSDIYSVYRTTGSGQILVFQDGIVSTGTWERATNKDNYTFKDKNGLPMQLNKGQTWVTATEDTADITYTP